MQYTILKVFDKINDYYIQNILINDILISKYVYWVWP